MNGRSPGVKPRSEHTRDVVYMGVIVIATSEPSQIAWLVTKVVVVVHVDAECVGMLMEFHIPSANNGRSIVVGFRFGASSNEVLCFFCIIPREVEYIARPRDKAMGSVLIVEGRFHNDA